MRETISLNRKWAFTMDASRAPEAMPSPAYFVNLPHTFNAIDGQDGGNDYHRGLCYYVKQLPREEISQAERLYLEFKGANASVDVYVNGRHVCHHDGGYSTFRAEVTQAIGREGDALIVVGVDNGASDTVYPQMADFTFYGGLYRDVSLIGVPRSHFDLCCYGGPGIAVTPVMWHGRKDPYLYTAEADLLAEGKVLDSVRARFGCRSFEIDPQRGFFLNGEAYPLRGVSRHQDRWGIGNALLPEHHREDMDLICELGANTIRLAHYQHDQLFYDLCDERGMVVWAEIPYISKHMPGGEANTLSQMKELIIQNYNHPSIVVWGLSNEITMNTGASERNSMLANHKKLNDLCHSMDRTRKTVMAYVSMCDKNDPIVQIPDVVSYNHYFGWYGGDTSMNGPWLDDFHKTFPRIPLGVSEYGCEALNWHTSDPTAGDYTEEYQAYYHEELIKQLFTRPYLWATHVWNMFDFGADARAEGGENGQNHKGLVTFDRTYKKDAFYAYKAWLSEDPFVHLCGKRYVERVEPVTKVTVYSNQPEVELFADGKSLGRQRSDLHFFYFDVPNEGETHLLAVAGDCRDESVIRRVEVFNEAYRLRERGAVLNWFDVTQRDGHLSLTDKLSDIMRSPEGARLIRETLTPRGDEKAAGFEINEDTMKMMGGFTMLRLTGMLGMAGIKLSKEELLALNEKLNQIEKV